MASGIKAWQGMKASGGPEAGMPYFSPAGDLREAVALAWSLEEGSRRFYARLAESRSGDQQARILFEELERAEEHHKGQLLAAYRDLAGGRGEIEEALAAFGGVRSGETMEGNVLVETALGWTAGRELVEVVELAMGLEVNAYDLYIKMSRLAAETRKRQIFRSLSEEEQRHLERLGELMDALHAGHYGH